MTPATPCPVTPKTATVLDFRCLFTHDLKRKRKRWQDGRLTFHTFNQRVMVYDQDGNFIGDTHWRGADAIYDGDEMQLDRGGVIVQVSELMGKKEQDLSEIFAKRTRPVAQAPEARTLVFENDPAHDSTPLSRSRGSSLQKILSTPGRQLGRAVISAISPFEKRQALQREPIQEPATPPHKRMRLNSAQLRKSSYATSLFGAPLNLSSQPSSSVVLVHQGPSGESSSSMIQVRPAELRSLVAPSSAGLHSNRFGSVPSETPISSLKSSRTDGRGAKKCENEKEPVRQESVGLQHTDQVVSVAPDCVHSGTAPRGEILPSEPAGGSGANHAGRTIPAKSDLRGDQPRRTPGLGIAHSARQTISIVRSGPSKAPTAELRLRSFQKRGLLISKAPLSEVAMHKKRSQAVTQCPIAAVEDPVSRVPNKDTRDEQAPSRADIQSRNQPSRSERLDFQKASPKLSCTEAVQPGIGGVERNLLSSGPAESSNLIRSDRLGPKGGPWSREAHDLLDQGRPTQET